MAIIGLRWAVAAGLLFLGATVGAQWVRGRHSTVPSLGIALILLSAVSIMSNFIAMFGANRALGYAILLAFTFSGLAVLRFRSHLVSLPATAFRLGTGVSLALPAAALVLVVAYPGNRPANLGVALAIAAFWMIILTEAAVRLWWASGGLPGVQKARLRSLGLGLGGLAGLVALAVIAIPFRTSKDWFGVGLEAAALGLLPVIYLAFLPPAWTRQMWREGEERAFRDAMTDLVLFSPDRPTLARRSLRWALRLVGGATGVILDQQGQPLAAIGPGHDLQALRRWRKSAGNGPTMDVETGMVLVPLHLRGGAGLLAVAAGKFTPLFGDDELGRLAEYGASLAVALDRVQLTEEMQRKEAELRAAREAAEAASEAKSEHLSRMSHELRTPMSAILGFAELLDLRSPRPDQMEPLQAIIRAGNHLLALINDVLDISRLEATGSSFSLEPVQLETLLDETWQLLGGEAAGRHIQFHAHAAGNTGVIGDRQRLKQVVLNLLSNAVKYNREGGAVTTTFETRNGTVRLSVSDQGPGIDSTRLPRLFTPFDRLGAERTDVEGTGLGLALSKRLIEAMGGSIGVQTAAGEGATFWIELPRSSPGARGPSATQTDEEIGEPIWGGRKKILYVEDNMPNVTLMESILELRPTVHLITALQGSRALDIARDQHPDLILLDLHLPDMPGDEILQRLRRDSQTADIPVVIISADATEKQVSRLLRLGARAYLTKPLKVRRFLEVLDAIFSADGESGAHAQITGAASRRLST